MACSPFLRLIACSKTAIKVFFAVVFIMPLAVQGQSVINLYQGEIPGAINTVDGQKKEVAKDAAIYLSKVSVPTLTVFLPSGKNTSTAAVIICPGGGYGGLSMTHEGTEVAELFAKNGIAAFVLKYRLPSDKIMKQKEFGPLQDAQEAMVLLRKDAKKWNLDTAKIGIMGFSAGGHLAATAGTHFAGVIKDDAHQFIRPNFMMLIYPVISMTDSLTHKGSRYNLLGKMPTEEMKILFSNELQITQKTPPSFLVHSQDDPLVPVKNSLIFYESLLENKIPVEMHLYPKGGHGFGLVNSTTKDRWFDRCINWMQASGWIGN